MYFATELLVLVGRGLVARLFDFDWILLCQHLRYGGEEELHICLLVFALDCHSFGITLEHTLIYSIDKA